MIIKERKKSIYLRQLEALVRRVPRGHGKREEILLMAKKAGKGYRGEQAIDYPLSFLSEDKYFILHDVRLLGGHHYFQLDTLILSEYFIVILEVKNISGIL
ncbi:MAG TPA: nuclease-related domain-containing protein [Chondromyces sp.]|nr:nuclease-related domain-containing protein [Chondromyces sp.]